MYLFESYLPSPNPDDSDDGKTLVVNKHKWELKTPTGGGSSDAVLYTPQTLTDAQKKQARDNVDAAGVFVVKGTIDLGGAPTLDKTFAQIKEAINAGKSPIAVYGDEIYLALTINDETAIMFSGIVVDRGVPKIAGLSIYSNESAEVFLDRFLILKPDGTMAQTSMVAGPTEDMQIATKSMWTMLCPEHPSQLNSAIIMPRHQRPLLMKLKPRLRPVMPRFWNQLLVTFSVLCLTGDLAVLVDLRYNMAHLILTLTERLRLTFIR